MWAHLLLGGIMLSIKSAIGVSVDNIQAGDVVDYPLVIIRGHTDQGGVRAGLAGSPTIYFPAFQGRYVALCELKPGGNFVVVRAGDDSLKLRIDYAPSKSPYRVKAVWLTSKPVDPPILRDTRARVDLALKLAQSLTAEKMWEAGCGRRTFQLALSRDGKVDLANPAPGETSSDDTISLLRKGLGSALDDERSRYVAFTTRQLPSSPTAQICLSQADAVAYWPNAVATVVKTFANRTPADPTLAAMDTFERGTVWGGYAATLGAMVRGIGVSLGLSPTASPTDLMGDGYGSINRVFLAYEPPCKAHADEVPVYPSSGPQWTLDEARRLAASPFFK